MYSISISIPFLNFVDKYTDTYDAKGLLALKGFSGG